MLKKIILFLWFLFWLFVYTYSYKVDVPQTDVTYNSVSEDTVDWWNEEYINLSEKINRYLWFFMWTISFVVVVYAWFLLMSSNGNPEDLKKWNKMLTWGLIWIFVSLLSYVIVKLLIGLF